MAKSVSSSTCTVALKMPTGLVIFEEVSVDFAEPAPAGSITRKRWEPTGKRVTLKGFAMPFGEAPRHDISGGYGLTHGVDTSFMLNWLEQHKDDDIVKNNLIFIADSAHYAADEAKEKQEIKSGLEPINPSGDPRTPKNVQKAA